MRTNNLIDEAPGITMYRHRPPKVEFDEHAQPYDVVSEPPPVLIDWDVLEEMILGGKFETRSEVISWCESVYTLLREEWDRDKTWRRIRDGLTPEVVAAYMALPNQIYIGSTSDPERAQKILEVGKCRNGHKIKSMDDLGTNGRNKDGSPRLGCIHCRRARSARKRKADKKKGK